MNRLKLPGPERSREIVVDALMYCVMTVWFVLTVYPFIFLVQNSFKGSMEFYRGGVWKLPESFSLTNYFRVFEHDFVRYFMNSAVVVAASLLLLLAAGSAAAFAISRLKFSGRSFIFLLFVSGMTIPIHITLVPVYLMTRYIGLYDSLWSLVGPFVAMNLPLTVFILSSFMGEIPKSLEEAAYMDGARRRQVFSMIVVPISRPAMTTVGIYNSIILWNEFVFPLVLINTEKYRPLTLALWNFQGEFAADVPAIMALLLLTMLPLLIVYTLTKEMLIKGLVAGAIKG